MGHRRSSRRGGTKNLRLVPCRKRTAANRQAVGKGADFSSYGLLSLYGEKGRNPLPAEPYQWSSSTVENILANRQYTGCTVNFQTTTVSYKVHKTVYKPEEEWQIIPDTQEAIISEVLWERVQELRQN